MLETVPCPTWMMAHHRPAARRALRTRYTAAAIDPHRCEDTKAVREPRPTEHAATRRLGYWLLAILEVPIVLDVALADDFPSAVNEKELA
jgi:hypothetical protein